jgi:phage shock protein E
VLRLVLPLVLSFAACSKTESPAPPPATTTSAKPAKDPEAARKMIAGGAVVVDVRTPDEFGEGHLPQATNIPIQDFAQRIAEVDALAGNDKARPIVVYCASGNRSGKAKQQLEAAGYTQVVNGGGLDDLQ